MHDDSRLQPTPKGRPRRGRLAYPLGALFVVVAFVMVLVVGSAANRALAPRTGALTSDLLSGAFKLVSMTAAVTLITRFCGGLSRSDIGLAPRTHTGRRLAFGVVLGSAMALASYGLSVAAGGYSPHLLPLAPEKGLAISILTALGVGFEEVAFRAGVMGSLQATLPRWMVVLLPAALFSAVHANNPGASLAGIANAMLLSLLLGLLYIDLTSRPTIWAPIGWHFGWNMMVASVGTPVSGVARQYLLSSTPRGTFWSGGAFGLEASPATSAIALIALLLYGLQRRRFATYLSR